MLKAIWQFISDEVEMIYGAFFKSGNPGERRYEHHDSVKATRFMDDEFNGRY